MAKHQSKRRKRQRAGRGFSLPRLRGPVIILGIAVAAVVGVVVLVTLGMATQDRTSIKRIEGISAEGRTLGEANAPVTIIEFADYQCPHCKHFAGTVENDLQEQYIATGVVQFEFRNLAIVGEESILAAQAAQCAADQGKFWEYHDLLFEHQQAENSGAFSSENLLGFADDAGLERDVFIQCMTDAKYASLVSDESAAARDLGASGTPFFVITTGPDDDGPLTLQGEHTIDDFGQAIRQKLAEATAAP